MSASRRTGSRRERTASTSSSNPGGGPLDDLLSIDYAAAADGAVRLIERTLASSGASGVVLGLSGGLDSAVAAAICAKAAKTMALILPDSDVTPGSDTEDAQDFAKSLGIAHKTIDIKPIVAELARNVGPNERSLGNTRARIRMCLLYYHANTHGSLVIGTSDRSEALIGYYTKHGDGAGDVFPIASLYKVQVRGMARHLGIPAAIAQKKSAPRLWADHDAEGELGMAYEDIDAALHCIIDKQMDDASAAGAAKLSQETVARVRALHEASAHKRKAAPGACTE